MHEETIAFEPHADIAGLVASGALRGSLAQFAQPRGANLMRRTEALDDWCRLRAAHGVWPDAYAPGPATAGMDFAFGDCLALASHPAVHEAGRAAWDEAAGHSAGTASMGGNSPLSLALEAALGTLLRCEHVTLFPSGSGAAFGAITGLVHAPDYVLVDQLADASLRQGANAATGKVVLHRHLDTGHVRELLAAIRARDAANAILVVTEGLFGMDAEVPDLPLMQHLCREYDASLLVDVSHDLGALGPGGTGSLGLQSMLGKADLVLGSFSETFASNGGFVASASRAVKRRLQLFAGPHRFSNALAPIQAACLLEALRIVASPEGDDLRAALLRNALVLRASLAESGMRCLGQPSAVVPLWIGNEQVARLAGRALAQAGVLADTVEYPEVAQNAARLRLQVTAGHAPVQLRQAAQMIGAAVSGAGAALGLEPVPRPWPRGRARG